MTPSGFVNAGSMPVQRPRWLRCNLANLVNGPDTEVRPASFGLSAKERIVLQLLSEGRSNQSMARELCIEVSTVKAHVAKIMRRLGCKNRTQAALLGFCMERQLVDDAKQLISRLL